MMTQKVAIRVLVTSVLYQGLTGTVQAAVCNVAAGIKLLPGQFKRQVQTRDVCFGVVVNLLGTAVNVTSSNGVKMLITQLVT